MSGYTESKLNHFIDGLSTDEFKLLKQLIQQRDKQQPTEPKSNPRLFDELGLVGGWQIEDTKLSTNYKQVITEQLKVKHGYS